MEEPSFTFDELREWVKAEADPECKNCDGRGVWMGNVALCGCVGHKESYRQGKHDGMVAAMGVCRSTAAGGVTKIIEAVAKRAEIVARQIARKKTK